MWGDLSGGSAHVPRSRCSWRSLVSSGEARRDTPLGGPQSSTARMGTLELLGRRSAHGSSPGDRPWLRDTDPSHTQARPQPRLHQETSSRRGRDAQRSLCLKTLMSDFKLGRGMEDGKRGRRGWGAITGIIHKPHTGPFIGPQTHPCGYAKIY